jgi:hypothetical protein
MSLLTGFKAQEPEAYKQPNEGWQRVTCISFKEDTTFNGKERLTIDVRAENDAEVKYAYSIIGSSEYTNTNITGVFRAFGIDVSSAIPQFSFLKDKTATAYLCKIPNQEGNEYWKIRNFRFVNSKGETVETWYPTGKKREQAKPAKTQMAQEVFGDDKECPF